MEDLFDATPTTSRAITFHFINGKSVKECETDLFFGNNTVVFKAEIAYDVVAALDAVGDWTDSQSSFDGVGGGEVMELPFNSVFKQPEVGKDFNGERKLE